MSGFLIRTAISALGLGLADALLSRMWIGGVGTLVLAALLLGVVNALVKPVVVFFTIPITCLTLGGFILVINTLMLGLVAGLLSDFDGGGAFTLFIASLIVSAVSLMGSWFVGPHRDRKHH